jgi:hypothetical protein
VSRTDAERTARYSSGTTSIEELPRYAPPFVAGIARVCANDELHVCGFTYRSTAEDDQKDKVEAVPQKIDQPKSGWLHDTLQRILANISVQARSNHGTSAFRRC